MSGLSAIELNPVRNSPSCECWHRVIYLHTVCHSVMHLQLLLNLFGLKLKTDLVCRLTHGWLTDIWDALIPVNTSFGPCT